MIMDPYISKSGEFKDYFHQTLRTECFVNTLVMESPNVYTRIIKLPEPGVIPEVEERDDPDHPEAFRAYFMGYPIRMIRSVKARNNPYYFLSYGYNHENYPIYSGIKHEINLVQNGLTESHQVIRYLPNYKKCRKGSSLDFDGGYTHVKLYLEKTWEKGLPQLLKIVFLTPTQAEFNKDTTRLAIHPYPWFNGKTVFVDEGDPDPEVYYGLYTEDDECVLISTLNYTPAGPLTKKEEEDRYAHSELITEPLLHQIERVYEDNQFGLAVHGTRILHESILFHLYEEQEKLWKTRKPPYTYRVFYSVKGPKYITDIQIEK